MGWTAKVEVRLVALILVLGVAAYTYQMHAAATGIEIEEVSVAGFTLEGF